MDVPPLFARPRILVILWSLALVCSTSGCTEWMTNTSPGDLWERVTPSKQAWDSISPSTLWAKLGRLNYEEEGLSPDVYY